MDSFSRASMYQYNPNSNTIVEVDDGETTDFSGILDIFVHHARNIHNICIYEKQDVYAKFSLTYNPDEILSTRVINGGGKNPQFNENLVIKVAQPDAVLKCEVWMLSRVRNYMEDQLLGFALVPISLVFGKGKVTRDFSLSSTDLFHSPAGTVQLTLSLNTSLSIDSAIKSSATNSSITSEVVILDPVEYSRIEFPDINVATENHKMVSDYYDLAGGAPFLHLGSSPRSVVVDDYEMAANSSEENNRGGSISPNSGFLSSTTTSLSDDRNSGESIEKKKHIMIGESSSNENSGEANHSKGDEKESIFSNKDEEIEKDGDMGCAKYGQVFGNISSADAEESAMQKQIVDMYMRSVQQFTESLAKMKLPIDMAKTEHEDRGEVIQNHGNKLEVDKKKKDGSRVFYGSRAFF